MRLIFTAKTSNSANAPRNLYQIDMLYNNSRFLFRNQTILTSMSNNAYTSLAYSEGFLLYTENMTYVNPDTNKTAW